MNKNHPHLNVLSIWEPIPTDEFYTKEYISRRTYLMPDGTISVATPEKPIYAYAKGYTKGKKDFCLFLYSDSKNKKAIEKFMDKALKSVKVADISEALVIATTGGFKYTTEVYRESK